MKIFISGSMAIKKIDAQVTERMDHIMRSEFSILLGDANGVDASIQRELHVKRYRNVAIYCSGDRARNNIGGWHVEKIMTGQTKNRREFFTAKDIQMAKDCDYGLMIWDSKSVGTLSNVYELVSRGKKSRVFVNKQKIFVTVADSDGFQRLISMMAPDSFEKADKKIQLKKKLEGLKCK